MLILFIVCVFTVSIYVILYLREVELNRNGRNKNGTEKRKFENDQ